MSEQHDEEILRRRMREQEEIERQTDALVLKALTALVTEGDKLKSKLRRDTETILEEYRRTKRGLENEISLVTAERQRFHREIDERRVAIVAEAEARAQEIVAEAERQRDQILADAHARERRLRGLEDQIRSVFGVDLSAPPPEASIPDADDADAEPAVEPAPTEAFVPASAAGLNTPACAREYHRRPGLLAAGRRRSEQRRD